MEFIDYRLVPEEKAACKLWAEETDFNSLELANEVCRTGYRFTFTRDKQNNCFVVTLIGRKAGEPNHEKAMSTRHETIGKALVMSLYKHLVIFGSASWADESGESMFG